MEKCDFGHDHGFEESTPEGKDDDKTDGTPHKRKFRENIKTDEEEEESGVKKQKFLSFNMKSNVSDAGKNNPSTGPSISIKLASQKSKREPPKTEEKKKSSSVAQAFNNESDSEEEEMPPEAKMRMRNIGRDTPTSSGPNSFGKTKQGFCDMKKLFERDLKKKMDDLSKS